MLLCRHATVMRSVELLFGVRQPQHERGDGRAALPAVYGAHPVRLHDPRARDASILVSFMAGWLLSSPACVSCAWLICVCCCGRCGHCRSWAVKLNVAHYSWGALMINQYGHGSAAGFGERAAARSDMRVWF